MTRHLLAAAALSGLLAGPAAAMTAYDVTIPTLEGRGDVATVTGTITTDGTLGQIDEGAILDWSLTFTGTSGLDLKMTPTDSAFGLASLFAWGMVATEDGLFLIDDPSTFFQVGYEDPTYATETYLLFSSGQFALTVRNDEMDLWAFADALMSPENPDWMVLAEAPRAGSPVPLPAAAWLLAAGIAGLGAVSRRRRA